MPVLRLQLLASLALCGNLALCGSLALAQGTQPTPPPRPKEIDAPAPVPAPPPVVKPPSPPPEPEPAPVIIPGKVNLNAADANTLSALPEIGKARQILIIAERGRGKYKSWEDFVKRMDGTAVTREVLEKIKDGVSF